MSKTAAHAAEEQKAKEHPEHAAHHDYTVRRGARALNNKPASAQPCCGTARGERAAYAAQTLARVPIRADTRCGR